MFIKFNFLRAGVDADSRRWKLAWWSVARIQVLSDDALGPRLQAFQGMWLARLHNCPAFSDGNSL